MALSNYLFYIISPTHIITSLSSLIMNYKYSESSIFVTVLIHWPSFNSDQLKELECLINTLIKGFNYIDNVITFSTSEKDSIVQKS